jgi:hypothetical protein
MSQLFDIKGMAGFKKNKKNLGKFHQKISSFHDVLI